MMIMEGFLVMMIMDGLLVMMIMDGLVTKGVHKDRAANKAKFFKERGEPDHYV